MYYYSLFKQYGGGSCSICGAVGVTKTTCPYNSKAKNPLPNKHNKQPLKTSKVESGRRAGADAGESNHPLIIHLESGYPHKNKMNNVILYSLLCGDEIRDAHVERSLDQAEGIYILYDNKALPFAQFEKKITKQNSTKELLSIIKEFKPLKGFATYRTLKPNSYQIDLICAVGYGKILMKKLEDMARSKNADGIHLEAARVSLVNFYRSMGYRFGQSCLDEEPEHLVQLWDNLNSRGKPSSEVLEFLWYVWEKPSSTDEEEEYFKRWDDAFSITKIFEMLEKYKAYDGGIHMFKCLS